MLMVLIIACLSVGTLIYARTATRKGIAVRSALGASRGASSVNFSWRPSCWRRSRLRSDSSPPTGR